MSDMVERVARAIAERGGSNWDSCKKAPGQMMLKMYERMARAAIEAMREPTKGMIYLGNSKIDDCIDSWNYDSDTGYSVEPHAARDTWQAMLDAALSPAKVDEAG